MKGSLIVVFLAVSFLTVGCMGEDETPDSTTGQAPPAASTERTPDAVTALLVGTWDFDLKFPSGDAIPMLREIAADGTGYQYAKEDGEIGKRSFQWTLSDDGKTLTLAYSEIMKVPYVIDELEEGKLVMTPQTSGGLPEECTKR